MATKRLRKELDQVGTYGVKNVKSIGPKGDSLFSWEAKMYGPENSPYEGGVFKIDIDFPAQYPFRAPKVKFNTPLYHPSVCKSSGKLCAEVIEDGWKPNRSVSWVIGVLQDILTNPSSTSPLNPDVARQFERNPSGFHQRAVEWTRLYARK